MAVDGYARAEKGLQDKESLAKGRANATDPLADEKSTATDSGDVSRAGTAGTADAEQAQNVQQALSTEGRSDAELAQIAHNKATMKLHIKAPATHPEVPLVCANHACRGS
jgi:hypothetical protein